MSLCSIERHSHDIVGVYAILNKRTIPMINESVELGETRSFLLARDFFFTLDVYNKRTFALRYLRVGVQLHTIAADQDDSRKG